MYKNYFLMQVIFSTEKLPIYHGALLIYLHLKFYEKPYRKSRFRRRYAGC